MNNNPNMNHGNMNNVNFGNINPNNFAPKVRNNLLHQNTLHAGYGNYKVCPTRGSVKFSYRSALDPGTINSQCKVMVFNKHPIDVASTLCNHGLNTLTQQTPIPAIMYPLGREFLGTNFESKEGIFDENVILRTNYAYVIKKQDGLFPINGDKDVVYSNPITTIRDVNYNPLNLDQVFKTAVITVCPDRSEELLVDKIKDGDKVTENKILSSIDLLKFQLQIEAVFQAAICGYHNALLLTVFGKEFGIPVNDQVLIFNNCIMKYGHKFKAVMICIPAYEGKDLAEHFEKQIVKPHEITKHIDMKYEEEAMAQRMMGGKSREMSGKNSKNNSKQDVNDKDMLKQKMSGMDDDERMKMLKKIIKKKKGSKNKRK